MSIFELIAHINTTLGKLRTQTSEATDERLFVMSEIISAIRTIKMYVWEIPFSRLIEQKRRYDLNVQDFISQ